VKFQGLKARKDLGQHFLADEEAIAQIIAAAEIKASDTVVEIGPGPGVLTPLIADAAKKVIAVELDSAMIPHLKRAVSAHSNVEILEGDVLAVDPTEYPAPYSVVSNVPYYITSAILRHFLECANKPERMTLTVQREVAQRIVATPPKMSILALSIQLYGSPEIAEIIPRKSFVPPPEVDSAILVIRDIGKDTKKRLDGLSEEAFFTLVRAGFSEKRKQLHNSLARNLDLSHEQAVGLLESVNVNPQRRAETVTIAEWVSIGQAYGSIAR
jgi:16S rRNA (adenine1518-N6/adenine1519-N6)-dimethyltransferase